MKNATSGRTATGIMGPMTNAVHNDHGNPGIRALLFMREHVVLTISAVAALVTVFIVPPDIAYLGYIDWTAIGCLFCVLAVANAFRFLGTFDRAARLTLEHLSTVRSVVAALVLTTALLSMVATNDMALIVMLPLSAMTLVKAGWHRTIPLAFTMQSIAANLCGMVVPFGNPQNLYLYSFYGLGLGAFLETMLPPFLLSVCLIAGALGLLLRRAQEGPAPMKAPSKLPLGRRRLCAYTALLGLTLLAVFRVIPAFAVAVIIVGVLLYADRRALKAVDWALLLTFVCFFIFSGNVARMPLVSNWLTDAVTGHELLVSAGLSQIISNVPAAVLLSHFTGEWQALLVGVNIGGAGTLVGSLASLIALQHFMSVRKVFPALRNEPALSTVSFLKLFCGMNALFLVLLLAFCLAI